MKPTRFAHRRYALFIQIRKVDASNGGAEFFMEGFYLHGMNQIRLTQESLPTEDKSEKDTMLKRRASLLHRKIRLIFPLVLKVHKMG